MVGYSKVYVIVITLQTAEASTLEESDFSHRFAKRQIVPQHLDDIEYIVGVVKVELVNERDSNFYKINKHVYVLY